MIQEVLIAIAVTIVAASLISFNLGFSAGQAWKEYTFGRDIMNGRQKIRHEL